MQVKAKAYLLPFPVEFPDNLRLDDKTVIRKLTPDEKEIKRQNLLSMRSVDLTSLKYCIEWTLDDFDRTNPSGVWETARKNIDEKLDQVILALRLFKAGSIGSNEFDLFWDGQYGGTISRITYFWGEAYTLSENEKENFVNFFEKLKSLSPVEFAETALQRFKSSYERESPKDRLVDLFIAFESLFLPNSGELTYRLQLSIAAYIGNFGERKKIFDDVGKGYKLRSSIVHGEAVNEEKVKEILLISEDYFRKCISKILQHKQGFTKNKFREYVEMQILKEP